MWPRLMSPPGSAGFAGADEAGEGLCSRLPHGAGLTRRRCAAPRETIAVPFACMQNRSMIDGAWVNLEWLLVSCSYGQQNGQTDLGHPTLTRSRGAAGGSGPGIAPSSGRLAKNASFR